MSSKEFRASLPPDTRELRIPTIALERAGVDGQILVINDLLG